MLRYAIAHPDGRLFSCWRTRQEILWARGPDFAAWYRRRAVAEQHLGRVQQCEPEAHLVEQETEDL